MITSFSEDERVIAAIQAGALGYILKDASPNELEEAIQVVSRGQSYLPPNIAGKIVRQFHKAEPAEKPVQALTAREKEIIRRVAQGQSNEDIAQDLFLSPWTVRSHMGRIMKKLQVENRTQVALYAIRSGIVAVYPVA